MRVRLSSSGHYPDQVVNITEEEFMEVRELEKHSYLSDSPRGQELIDDFCSRTQEEDIPEIVVYV